MDLIPAIGISRKAQALYMKKNRNALAPKHKAQESYYLYAYRNPGLCSVYYQGQIQLFVKGGSKLVDDWGVFTFGILTQW